MTWFAVTETGLDEMIDAVAAIGGSPNFETIGRLEAVLHMGFLETQAATHVITGSLKLSGTTSSEFDGDVWTGTITYGGPSAGPNNPVEYAIYEMARGGAHDFLAPLTALDDAFLEAVAHHFEV